MTNRVLEKPHILTLPLELQQILIELVIQSARDSLPPIKSVEDETPSRSSRERQESLQVAVPGIRELIALSSTCSYYRNLLAPRLFGTLFLSNSESSAGSLQIIAKGSYATQVREIRYCGFPFAKGDNIEIMLYDDESTEGSDDSDEQEERNRPERFADAVKDVLENLSRFPNLYELSVEFAFSWDDIEEIHEIVHDEALIIDQDSTSSWRRLVHSSWKSICQNGPGLPSLRIRHYQCLHVDVFADELIPILKDLKAFSIEFQGYDNGAGWMLNTQMAFRHTAERLGNFFEHLVECETLRFHLDDSAPIGEASSENHMHHHVLELSDLPKLKHLDLMCIFVDEKFTKWLVARVPLLETLQMTNCACSSEYYEWSRLFLSLRQTGLKNLKSFELESSGLMLWDAFEEDEPDDSAEEQEQARAIAQYQAQGRRVFPYASLDDKYGMNFVDCEANRAYYLSGQDDREFKALMKLVGSNHESGS